MCGVLASISASAVPRPQFQAALDSIRHRGPDGEGYFADGGIQIGHRRLAIIDLSDQGAQPMTDPASGAVISFNGEIYNYIELRDELKARGHQFRTHSDTEVLLKAWTEWREGMTRYLNGMWAIIIWDAATRTLFLSRDRFGVKPLYYAHSGDRLLIASEPKAILAIDPALAVINLTALYDLFISSRGILGAQTFFKPVAALPPGHNATCTVAADGTPGPLKLTSYWGYPDPEDTHISQQQSAEAFEEIFESAVALRMRSDVPVGLTLSGGLDSSAILAAVSVRQNQKIQCFTSVYSATERGEEHWAAQAAAVHQQPLAAIAADEAGWLDTLRQAVHHMDAPNQSSAVFPLWTVTKAAREQGVPVLLEGQGADELLGGYAQYMPFQSRHLLKEMAFGRAGPGDMIDHWQGSSATFGRRWSALWHVRAVAEPAYKAMQRLFGRGRLFAPDTMPDHGYDMVIPATPHRRGGLYRKMLADHMRDVLPSLLHYGDAVTMAHGVESRLPFMDYRLVEWVFRSQPPVLSAGLTKSPIRHYLQKHGYGAIAQRTDKKGYPTPIVRWIQGNEHFIRDDILGRSNARLWDIFDRKAVTRTFEASLKGEIASAFHFYKIIPTHLWLEQLPDSV